jgi:ribosomal-protein-alanine N-acetyltransferase
VSDPLLEPAGEGDLPEVAALERACYADPWPASAFAGLHVNPAVHFEVLREVAGSKVVGYVIAWFVADEGEIANLAVAPAFRGRGFGQRLLDSVIRDAAERGIRSLFLEVRESNAAARKLYASRNFQEVGRRKRYYRSPEEDALILRCTLKR